MTKCKHEEQVERLNQKIENFWKENCKDSSKEESDYRFYYHQIIEQQYLQLKNYMKAQKEHTDHQMAILMCDIADIVSGIKHIFFLIAVIGGLMVIENILIRLIK